MIRSAAFLTLVAALSAAPTLAAAQSSETIQSGGTTQPANSAQPDGAAGTSAAPEKAAAAPKTTANGERLVPVTRVPGMTVYGKHPPCKAGDQACIDAVTQAVWTRYPKQMAILCMNQRNFLMREGFVMQDLGYRTDRVISHMTPETKQLCDYGDKLGKR